MDRGVPRGQHTRDCLIKNGLDPLEEDAHPKPNHDSDDSSDEEDKKPAARTYTDITLEMKARTKELATGNLTMLECKIWENIVRWANENYDRNWHGLTEQQCLAMVRRSRAKLGFGRALNTVENLPEYNMMTDSERPFLHFSAKWPHPEKPKESMRTMIFANPILLNLLKGNVDIFCDATFHPCTPAPFYQCLIIMMFDNQTSSYVPVIYALMTHKCSELYSHVFSQIANTLMKGKMKIRTYTTDFERGMMNMLALQGGTHVGCLFHLKQAWLKYLKDDCGMALASSLEGAMAVQGLDLLCVLPREEVLEYGIPFVRYSIEIDLPEWELSGWEKFWKYFVRQWMPILSSWNIKQDDGTIIPMVNRTNNSLECYNRRFNSLFPKTPSIIEFVQVIEKESRYQAEKLDNIRSGKRAEVERGQLWIPEIPKAYYNLQGTLEPSGQTQGEVPTGLTQGKEVPVPTHPKKITSEIKRVPMGELTTNGGRPKRNRKAPKKSL